MGPTVFTFYLAVCMHYLSVEEEEELVSLLLKCAVIGYAHSRKEVFAIAQCVVERKGGQHVRLVEAIL